MMRPLHSKSLLIICISLFLIGATSNGHAFNVLKNIRQLDVEPANNLAVLQLVSEAELRRAPMEEIDNESSMTTEDSQWYCWAWDDEIPDPCQHMLTAISMVSDSDGWAVGYEGVILHWNGDKWTKFPSPTTNRLYAVDMISADEGWAVGSGVALKWNGIQWVLYTIPTSLQAVYMLSSDEGWAVGGGIYHWNGALWESHTPGGSWIDIDMVSSEDGWAVGYNGSMAHWNGVAWSSIDSATTERLESIDMVSSGDGWAVGANGTILRWNGTEWSDYDSPTSHWLLTVKMVSADNGWAMGFAGNNVILHWDGNSWTQFDLVPCPLFDIDVVSEDSAWAVGEWGDIYHWDGESWVAVVIPTDVALRSVDMVSANDGWAMGNDRNGLFALRWNGSNWTPYEDVYARNVRMLSATEGWAVGWEIYRWDGNEWHLSHYETGESFTAVTALNSHSAWAVGGAGLIRNWNGSSWQLSQSPTGVNLHGVDATSPQDVWVVGDEGTILRYTGSTWQVVDSPTTRRLYSIDMVSSTDGWIVGTGGTVLRWNGSQWNTFNANVSSTFTSYSVRMKSASDGWIVGNGGVILRWDGSEWSRVESPNKNALYDIDMVSEDEGWIVGSGSSILSYSPKKAWTLMYYLAADNNLGPGLAQQYEDLRLASANPNVNIVALSDAPETYTRYLEFSPTGGTSLSLGELSTGDPATLRDFILWAKTNYPAMNYGLVIYDHGMGLTGIAIDGDVPVGASQDCVSGGAQVDCLTLQDLRSALAESGPVDVVYTHACLMGMIEVAYQLRGLTDFYVGSEQIAWGPTSYAPFISSVNQSTSAEELAILMARNYYSRIHQGRPGTISVVRMSEVDDVVQNTSILAGLLRDRMSTIDNLLWSIKQDVQHFDSRSDNILDPGTDEIIDLYHFARLVRERISDAAVQTAADQLMDAINKYVIDVGYKRQWSGSFQENEQEIYWDLGDSHGVSIFFPSSSRSFYEGDWLDFAEGTSWNVPGSQSLLSQSSPEQDIGWGSMLVDYIAIRNPDDPDNPTPPSVVPLAELIQEPVAVTISGVRNGYRDISYGFTATVTPPTTTVPITYTWNATGQPTISHTGGISDVISLSWESAGPQTIALTVSNSAGSITAVHTVRVSQRFDIYLPMIFRSTTYGAWPPD